MFGGNHLQPDCSRLQQANSIGHVGNGGYGRCGHGSGRGNGDRGGGHNGASRDTTHDRCDINLCLFGYIFILLIKILRLIFMIQPRSSAKLFCVLLRARLGILIAHTLPLNIIILIPKQTLLSPNMMTPPLQKSTSLNLHLIPDITKGRKQVMRILMIFNGRVYISLWLSIQIIILTLKELSLFDIPLNM